MADSVRIVVCGDEGTGKTSLITYLVKDTFVAGKLQSKLPPITIEAPENITTTIVDTSALPQDRNTLRKEIRRSNVILLIYSDHYSYERVSLFWLPFFRSLGVNLPVILCANKADLSPDVEAEEEMMPIMTEFKEIDSCIRASAKEHKNVNEAFYLCQRAVTHPIAPLYDAKEQCLKPAAVAALQRIFFLCDKDQDGYLDDKELNMFQQRCFNKTLSETEIREIKTAVRKTSPSAATEDGVNEKGFILLNKYFAERGRHETIWTVLRAFQYTDNLSLKDSFLHPKFEVPPFSSAELSPIGYQFFVDRFILFDKDTDGGLNDEELNALFAPTPGLPPLWEESSFTTSTVRSDEGHITLQGWIALWSMTTFMEPSTTLAYLAYLGFESKERGGTTAALTVTKPRKRRRKPGKVERGVFLCYVVGASGSGKSTILDAFLNRPFTGTYVPTIKPRTAVNNVEMSGGKQCCLILQELGELEGAILENPARLNACDVICYTYDSSDPDSFSHVVELRNRYPQLDELPAVYAALKADLDKTTQRAAQQPDVYTQEQGMPTPLHVSATWNSISELFVTIGEAALYPSTAYPALEVEDTDRSNIYILSAVGVATAMSLYWILRRSGYLA